MVSFFCGRLIDLIGMRFFKGISIFGDDWLLSYHLFVNFDNIAIVLNEGVISAVQLVQYLTLSRYTGTRPFTNSTVCDLCVCVCDLCVCVCDTNFYKSVKFKLC